jgi:hypothetical protein
MFAIVIDIPMQRHATQSVLGRVNYTYTVHIEKDTEIIILYQLMTLPCKYTDIQLQIYTGTGTDRYRHIRTDTCMQLQVQIQVGVSQLYIHT